MPKISKLRAFLSPSPTAPFLLRLAPFVALAIVGLVILAGGAAGWTYTNSSSFCGTTCHTMPPQYATYLRSPHSRVTCVECHLGRESIDVMLGRKIEHSETVAAMLFHTYEYPIIAKKMRPANEACETCHLPSQFSADSMQEVRWVASDENNTPMSTYLWMKTGGGGTRQGLGKGIHWHVLNNVYFLAADPLEQDIPYVRVETPDGGVREYFEAGSGLTSESLAGKQLRKMDCITCHNRVSHEIPTPQQQVDQGFYSGQLSSDLPFLHQKALALLSASYPGPVQARSAFQSLKTDYQSANPPLEASRLGLVDQAIDFLTSAYEQTHFSDQKLDWQTHPSNIGHDQSAGCFRCHDGKHLSSTGEAIRLECNLCHSIPQQAESSQFVTNVSILRGPEPASHTSSLWIALHGKVIDTTCASCHPSQTPGMDWTQLNGNKPPEDGSFCGNGACHQSSLKFTGIQSTQVQNLLTSQLKLLQSLQP